MRETGHAMIRTLRSLLRPLLRGQAGVGALRASRQPIHMHSTAMLNREDFELVVKALRQLRVTPVSRLPRDADSIGFRIDLSSGLTTDALHLLEETRLVGLPHLAALSTMRAGDLCVLSEGRARVDPELQLLLRALGKCKEREFACLNELGDALLLALGDPWLVLDDIAEQLHRFGIPVSGYTTPLESSPANQLNLLLLHGGYYSRVPDAVFDSFGVHANDLQLHASKQRRLHADFDFIKSLDIERNPAATHTWDGRLGRSVRCDFTISAKRSLAWIAYSVPSGWRVDGPPMTAGQLLSTQDLVRWLEQAPAGHPGLVVLDAAHMRNEGQRDSPRDHSQLRALPYPFHHYLAFNSDIDWSTAAQQIAVLERLNDELGLPIATSFYLRSSSRHWVAAERVPAALPDSTTDLLAECAGRGAVDTLHGLQSSINVVVFERAAVNEWRPTPDNHVVYVEGFLVASRAELRGAALAITSGTGRAATLQAHRASSRSDANGLYYAYFPVPDELRTALSRSTTCSFVSGTADTSVIVQVTANDFDPIGVARSLRALGSGGIRPIAFTSHGGGANVLALGNLHAPEILNTYAQNAAHDLDEECSPYFLIRELMELGVRFFNPVGRTAAPDLVSIDRLAQPAQLKNGAAAIFFTRFLSMRHEALGLPSSWCYGKSLPHAAALGFQVSDVIQRLHWLPLGHGGVLYTHFGHNVGNQVCQRLAWTEETHAAFERVARYYHPDYADDASAFRLWIGPASSALLYSWVVKQAREFISVTGPSVRITPWHDAALQTQIPDLARHGIRLLHGITVYVDRAACAEASVDGRPVLSFTRNSADETGRESISFVDDSQPLLLLADEPTELCTGHPDGKYEIAITPASLAGMTHWSFELDWVADEVEVGFRDTRGALYLAGRGEAADVVWTIDSPQETGWRRFTYSLVARRPHPAGPPRGHIVAIVARMRSDNGAGSIKLRRVVLLRPQVSLGESGQGRVRP